MPQFYYQESALLPAAAGDCVEAARLTLAEMGAKPVVAGYRITGRGLFLIRNLVDEIRFNSTGNSICMILRRD